MYNRFVNRVLLSSIPLDLQWEKYCEHYIAFIFYWIVFILAGNKDMHISLDEFEFQPDPNTVIDYKVTCT